MMVSSPLEQHKAHHIQVNGREPKPYLKESEAQAGGSVSPNSNALQRRTNSRIIYGENTLNRDRGTKSKTKQMQEHTETSANRQRDAHKDTDSKNLDQMPRQSQLAKELRTCTQKTHKVSRDPNCKPTKNPSSSIKDSPQVRTD